MRKLIYNLPNFRGKQRLLIFLDSLLGISILNTRFNTKVEGYYSGGQDTAFLREKSENEILENLITALPENGFFIDIGANCGYYSALASTILKNNGIIISFEPSLREYRRLIWAKENNPTNCTWILINQAVGNSTGITKINSNNGHSGMNFISNDEGNQVCSITTLSNSLKELSLFEENRQIDLVKIDVEGYEMQVLIGMSELLENKKAKKIQVEVTDDYLKKFGFSKIIMFDYMNERGYVPIINSKEWQYNEVFVLSEDVK